MTKIKENLLSILDKILVGKYEKWSLFVVVFIDSVLAFLPAEIITFYYFLRHKKARVFFQSFLIGIASVLGGSILYFLSSNLISLFPSILKSSAYIQVSELVNYSIFIQLSTVIFFALTSSIPFSWLSILLGVLNINFLIVYVPAVFVGRFLRFFILAFLTERYGEKSMKLIKKYLKEFLILIFALILIALIIKFFVL